MCLGRTNGTSASCEDQFQKAAWLWCPERAPPAAGLSFVLRGLHGGAGGAGKTSAFTMQAVVFCLPEIQCMQVAEVGLWVLVVIHCG